MKRSKAESIYSTGKQVGLEKFYKEEDGKTSKVVKRTLAAKKKNSGKGPRFYQYNKFNKRRVITANNTEENSAQNINLENESNEEKETQNNA